MTDLQETGTVTGTRDKDYNLISYVQACLENALRMESYRKDAEQAGDTGLVDLFTRAQADSRKGAEIGKSLLAARLARGTVAAGTGGTSGTIPAEGEQPPTDVMAPNQSTPDQPELG